MGVRVPLSALNGLLAQMARAPALQAGGQGFDSLTVHILVFDTALPLGYEMLNRIQGKYDRCGETHKWVFSSKERTPDLHSGDWVRVPKYPPNETQKVWVKPQRDVKCREV